MSSDDLELSVERFGVSDFFKINIRGMDYYLPTVKLRGVFGTDLHLLAKKNDIVIPSLGEIVEYINGSDDGLCNLRAKLNKYPLVSSTSLQREDGGRWISIEEVNKDIRWKKMPNVPKRFAEYDSHGYISLVTSGNMRHEEKALTEKIFDKSYAAVFDALSRLSPQSEKLLFVPKSTIIFDDVRHNCVLAIARQDNALIIKEYKICGGNFCLL